MENKQQSGTQLEILILGGVCLMFIAHLWEMLVAWLEQPKHMFILISFLAIILTFVAINLLPKFKAKLAKYRHQKSIIGKDIDAVYCGKTDDKKEVWIKPRQRAMHTQVIGTTNAGKTESVILPWAIQDIKAGRGLILIDGKADNSLLDKLWTYCVQIGRQQDFRLISLSHLENSHQFNPLIGGSAEEITERVFNSFEFENPYYRSLQYEVMGQVMRIFESAKEVPTFQRLHQVISNTVVLEKLSDKTKDVSLMNWVQYYKSLTGSERDLRTSGLLSAISQFSNGKTATLFNAGEKSLTIDDALKSNLIVYFQLPVLLSPFLGKATGKLVLQSLQSAVANRHRQIKAKEKPFFSVYLDDFSEYLYPGFVTILNKSRSANVGIVFAHQALGDIKALGDSVANAILTNSNIKVFMRGNDPESAEYFSKVIGTVGATKYTERQKRNFFLTQKSGDVSAREVEEFIVHPNLFKRELGVGEALMVIPHEQGAKTIKIKFKKFDDLKTKPLPTFTHTVLDKFNFVIESTDLLQPTEKKKEPKKEFGKQIINKQEAA